MTRPAANAETTVDPTAVADLNQLVAASAGCMRCELFRRATRTVPGAGSASAWLVLLGEQPGDREDLAGEPFVGPAGRLLDRVLRDARIDREETYLTNAVKHFKFEQRGKRRIHQKPTVGEIRACRPWLDAELRIVRPFVIALLGATAAQSLLGSSFKVSKHRGEVLDWEDGLLLVPTVHPSSILRTPTGRRGQAFDAMVADMKVVAARRPRRRS